MAADQIYTESYGPEVGRRNRLRVSSSREAIFTHWERDGASLIYSHTPTFVVIPTSLSRKALPEMMISSTNVKPATRPGRDVCALVKICYRAGRLSVSDLVMTKLLSAVLVFALVSSRPHADAAISVVGNGCCNTIAAKTIRLRCPPENGRSRANVPQRIVATA